MKQTIGFTVLCICLWPVVALAEADDKSAMQLAEEKQCMACHATDADVPRAPGFESIAQKYTQDDSDALVQVVMTGGEDHWGSAKMPEMDKRAEVTEKQAKKLVEWILNMHSEKM